MSVYQLQNGKYRVQVRRKGYPDYDKVFGTRQQAEEAEARVLGGKASTDAGNMTLDAAWAKYKVSALFTDKAENTRKTESCRIKPILEELGKYSLENLARDPGIIYDYIDGRVRTVSNKTRRKLSSTAVRLEIAALSAVVAWAKKRKIVRENFVSGISRGEQAKRKRRVPPVEQAALQNAVMTFDNPRLAEAARFAKLLLYLGCRPGELAGLLRADVRLSSQSVTFRKTKAKKEDRRVHATNDAVNTLDAQIQYANERAPESLFLFSTQSRKGEWVKYNYSYGIKLLRSESVLPEDFHAHAMRREFISRAIEGGVPYGTIRKQTGHHSTQAIEIYDEGLATAPDIRAALDGLAEKVNSEELLSHFALMGASEDTLERLKADFEGRSPKFIKRAFEAPITQPKKKSTP